MILSLDFLQECIFSVVNLYFLGLVIFRLLGSQLMNSYGNIRDNVCFLRGIRRQFMKNEHEKFKLKIKSKGDFNGNEEVYQQSG